MSHPRVSHPDVSHRPVLLAAQDVQVTYGSVTAVASANLEVREGEMVALLGASGSGKTTLLKAMSGFATTSSGTLRVLDHDLADIDAKGLRSVRSQVGQVFQRFHLVPRLSVMTNVLTGSLYRAGALGWLGGWRSDERALALRALQRVGLEHKATSRASRLSGGEQQRVAIARTLVQQPTLILADEPVASLDPRLAAGVLSLLRDICHQDGIAVVVSLHVMDLALEYCDRIVGMRNGRTVLDTPTADCSADTLRALYEDVDHED